MKKNSHRFDTDRNKDLFERPWLEKFTSLIPEGENILDIGCGSGRPITQYFIQQGCGNYLTKRQKRLNASTFY